jgi:hypothetical protein
MAKRSYEMCMKKSISMPEILFDKAEDRMRELGIVQLSHYFQRLVYKDVNSKEMDVSEKVP